MLNERDEKAQSVATVLVAILLSQHQCWGLAGGNSFKFCRMGREIVVRTSQSNRARPSKKRGRVLYKPMPKMECG